GAKWQNLSLTADKTYRVTFDAWSTHSRSAQNVPTLFCGENYAASELAIELSGAPAQAIVAPCTTPKAFSLDFAVGASTAAGSLRIVNGPALEFAEGWNVQNVRLFQL
ncbi:MAG TPA: hypothetical protein VM686_19485, partial [Polyangiaceae bacterium]|nr:hypothetical protein [Polyangiaceae bacterium]